MLEWIILHEIYEGYMINNKHVLHSWIQESLFHPTNIIGSSFFTESEINKIFPNFSEEFCNCTQEKHYATGNFDSLNPGEK